MQKYCRVKCFFKNVDKLHYNYFYTALNEIKRKYFTIHFRRDFSKFEKII